MPPDSSSPLTREACRAYLDETTFRLRPKDYERKYPKWPGSVGLEIEMLPVLPPVSPGQAPGRVRLHGPAGTSAAILRAEAARRGWKPTATEDDTGNPMLLTLLLESGDNLSFEPGGQVEFSSVPYPCLSDAVRRMREVQADLDQIYAREGLALTQVGINPWHQMSEIGLQMPKARYRAMDRYFSQIGEYGQRMMRQTCTIQVNLDFGPDESTLAKRYLASLLVAPMACATFAYSPVVDRQATGVRGFRSRVWRHADPTRTGLPGLERLGAHLTRETCIETYLDFVLGAQVVFVEALDYRVLSRPVTFGQWLEQPIDGVRPTAKDLATHLSLMFPEVRPRGFLELRSIDCQPRALEAAPAAYYTGLLYDTPTLDRLIERLLPLRAELPLLLEKSEDGLADPRLRDLSRQVMDLAQEGFSRLSPCFKANGTERELAFFRERFTERGRTPADDLLDKMRQDQTPFVTYAALRSLEESWAAASR